MKKAADLRDMVERAGSTISSGVHDAGDAIGNWYNSIEPARRHAVISGLLGAALGGAATGGMAAATPHDPEEKHPVLGPALLGALMGGGAGAGLSYGSNLLTGDAALPGLHDRKPAGASFMDAMGYPFTHHPGATTGLGVGTYYGLYGRGGKNFRAAADLMGKVPRAKGLGAVAEWVKAYAKALPKSFHPTSPKGALTGLAAIPAGLAVGALADKYLKGDY